jgi:hypothetical protein
MTATDSQKTNHYHHYCHDNHPQLWHNTDTNTAQRKRAPEEEDARAKEEEKLRDWWSDRVHGAVLRRMKRNVLAANAAFGTPEWVDADLSRFMPHYEEDVTRHAALAEECLDEARAHAKSKGWRPIPLDFLPRCILESEALEPYLKRWKRDDAAAAAAAAAAAEPTRARCARGWPHPLVAILGS